MVTMMLKVLCVMIACMMVSMPYTAAITCADVDGMTKVCLDIAKGGYANNPPPKCCDHLEDLEKAAYKNVDKRIACDCLMASFKQKYTDLTLEKDSLEAKYMAEDASSKKSLVSNFTNYKIIDSRSVMEQHNELLGILDFKHTLKHKKEELTLVELGSHLCIEESLRAQDSDKPKENNVVRPQLNIINNTGKSAFMSTFKLNDSIIRAESRILGDAIFDENRLSSVPRPSLRISNIIEDIGGSVIFEEVTEEVVQQPEPELRK
ncbi:zinc finger, CCHC-type containing protein, partial [Tanacetum coccineum]